MFLIKMIKMDILFLEWNIYFYQIKLKENRQEDREYEYLSRNNKKQNFLLILIKNKNLINFY